MRSKPKEESQNCGWSDRGQIRRATLRPRTHCMCHRFSETSYIGQNQQPFSLSVWDRQVESGIRKRTTPPRFLHETKSCQNQFYWLGFSFGTAFKNSETELYQSSMNNDSGSIGSALPSLITNRPARTINWSLYRDMQLDFLTSPL